MFGFVRHVCATARGVIHKLESYKKKKNWYQL